MIIPETSKHFSEKRLGTHSTHIPHFLHTHPQKHALLPNNNIYYFIIYIIIEVKVRGEGILGVCKIYVEYVYYVYFFLIFNATHWKYASYSVLILFNERNPKMPSRLLGNVSNFASRNKAPPFPVKGQGGAAHERIITIPLPLYGERMPAGRNLRSLMSFCE